MSVRIGFIGAGHISTSHLRNLIRMPEAEVVALCDLSPERIMLITDSGPSIEITDASGVRQLPNDPDPLWKEDHAFVSCVAEKRLDLILSDYESGVRTLAVTIAGEQSARTGRVVDISELYAREAPILSRTA